MYCYTVGSRNILPWGWMARMRPDRTATRCTQAEPWRNAKRLFGVPERAPSTTSGPRWCRDWPQASHFSTSTISAPATRTSTACVSCAMQLDHPSTLTSKMISNLCTASLPNYSSPAESDRLSLATGGVLCIDSLELMPVGILAMMITCQKAGVA